MSTSLTQAGLKSNEFIECYTMQNLLQNSSFETTSNWSGLNRDSTTSKFGTYSQNFLSGGTRLISQTLVKQPILNHKYYMRRYITTKGASVTYSDARHEIFNGDGVGLNFVFFWNGGTYNDWTMESNIVTLAPLNTTGYYFRTFTVNATNPVWIDGLMYIDLTETFGAGNEPTKEWMDTNIPYFDGIYTYNISVPYINNNTVFSPTFIEGGSIPMSIYTDKIQTLLLEEI